MENKKDSEWERMFEAYVEYAKVVRGQVNIEKDDVDQFGNPIGKWQYLQRCNRKHLMPYKKEKLEAINFIWNLREYKWQMNFNKYKEYSIKVGGCENVTNTAVDEDGFKVGFWQSNQRMRKHTLSKEKINELDSIGFIWKAETTDEKWDRDLEIYKRYAQSVGGCENVTAVSYDEFNNPVGKWQTWQRYNNNINNLSEYRKNRLDEIGFKWKIKDEEWMDSYEKYKEFANTVGGCEFVKNNDVDVDVEGNCVGKWQSYQRYNKKNMSDVRIELLDTIGFVWAAKTFEEQWLDSYEKYKKYMEIVGGCKNIIATSVDDSGYLIGRWQAYQRRNKENLTKNKLNC